MTTLFVTVQNRINNATDNGGSTATGVQGATGVEARLGWGRRWHHTIGSGDVDKIRFSYDNWRGEASNNQEFNTGNSHTITAGHMDYNGIIVPILFGGQRSVTIADGDAEILSDWIYPSQFSVAQFTRGDTFFTKEHGTVPGPTPATNGKMPTCYRQVADFTGCQMFFYAAGQTTLADIDVPGMFTSTGATRYDRSSGACPIVIGTYIGGDKPVRMAIGDSMTQGTGDSSAFKHGKGSFQRAQVDADGISNPYSSANFAVHGSAATLAVQGQKMRNYSKYANSLMINYGTNDFSLSGDSITVAGMMTRVNNIKNAFAAVGGVTRIGIHALGPRNNSTDAWATEANQTTLTNWGTGGNPDLYNQGLAAAGYDIVFPNTAVRGTDYHKFAANGTANLMAWDNTHYSTNGYIVTATEDRPLFAQLDPTFGVDTDPEVFTFTAATNATVDMLYTSNVVTITGIAAPANISIVGGSYKIGDGSWTTAPGTIANNETVSVRRNSSASNSTTVTAVLTVGTVSGTYSITTAAPVSDTTPNAFTFTAVPSANVNTEYTSNTVTITGIDAPATISITGGEYQINGGSWVTSAGTISNNQTVAVRRTSSSSASTAVTAVLTVGGVAGTYSITTAGGVDTTPDAFVFTPASDVSKNAMTTSNTITVAGINSAATITVANGEYQIDGGSWVSSSGTINNGQQVRVRRTSSSSDSTAVTATLTIGGVSGVFTVTTAAPIVVTPDPYLVVDAPRGWTSAGINDPLTFHVRPGDAPKGIQIEGSGMNLSNAVVTLYGITGATKSITIPANSGQIYLVDFAGYHIVKVSVLGIAAGTYVVKATPL